MPRRSLTCLLLILALACTLPVWCQGVPAAEADLADAAGQVQRYALSSLAPAGESPALLVPVELDPAALVGPAVPAGSDLAQASVREAAYRAVVRDVLLMADADMGEAHTRLRQVGDGCRVAGRVLSFPASLAEIAEWLKVPAVRAFYDRYPLLNRVPALVGLLVKGVGPYATGLRVTSDAFDVLQLLAINEVAVAHRGEVLAAAVAALPSPDPALAAALEPARDDAVAVARSFTAAAGRVLAQRYLAVGRVADAAALLSAAAKAGQAIAPAGLVRTLSRLAGPLAAAARKLQPYLATFRVQWDDVASARHNLQRAAMAATLLGSALAPAHLQAALTDLPALRTGLALAAYDAALLSAIMSEYLRRGTGGGLAWLRGLAASASGGKDAAFLAERARFHREARPEMLRLAGRLATAEPAAEAEPIAQPAAAG